MLSDRVYYTFLGVFLAAVIIPFAFVDSPPNEKTIATDKQAAKRYARHLCGNTPLQVGFYDYFEYYVTCDVRSPEVSLRFEDIPDEFYTVSSD